MKISKETLTIFRNFASMNSNLLIKAGNVIRTIATTKAVIAEATVSETFPVTFSIWDMGQFLSLVSLFTDPEFDFKEDHVVISSGTSSIKFNYSAQGLLLLPPEGQMGKNLDTITKLSISQSQLAECTKAASILQVASLAIGSDGIKTTLSVFNTKEPNSNQYGVDMGAGNGQKYQAIINVENIRVIPANYDVSLMVKKTPKGVRGVSYFQNDNLKIGYWLFLDASSTFGE